MASTLALRDGVPYADAAVSEIRERLGIPAFVEETLSVWGIHP